MTPFPRGLKIALSPRAERAAVIFFRTEEGNGPFSNCFPHCPLSRDSIVLSLWFKQNQNRLQPWFCGLRLAPLFLLAAVLRHSFHLKA